VKNPRHIAAAKKTARAVAVCLTGVLAVYLILVFAGGGWSPRLDDTFAWDGDSVLLFAHRGLWQRVPENCEAAFVEARQLGFKAVELDIQKTRDNQLAVFHDRSAQRLLGLDVRFGELSLTEIKQRKLLFKGRETTNCVPTLWQVFEDHGKTLRFYLDMKERGFRDADRIASLIHKYGLYDRTILASVDPLFVAYVEHKYPRINTALERFDAAQVWLYRLTPKRWKPDYLSGFACKAGSEHADWLKENNLLSKRIVYGAEGTNYQRMLDLGIRKAIVDYDPSLHSAALAQSAPDPADTAGISVRRPSERDGPITEN